MIADRIYHRDDKVLQGCRILIVDDNENNRRMARRQTSGWGMETTEASSGPQALKLLRDPELACDIALLDLHMPEMDGLALAEEIHNLAHRRDLPVVLLSSSSHTLSNEEKLHFSAQLTKPAKPRALQEVLKRVIKHQPRQKRAATQRAAELPKISQELPLRILLAEDTPVNSKVFLLMLSRMGYRADIVENGQEALDALSKGTYELVLLDIHMPVMDGLTCARHIRESYGDYPDGPRILALTANALQGDREKCLEAGFDAYLTKPLKPNQLEAALRELFLDADDPAPA